MDGLPAREVQARLAELLVVPGAYRALRERGPRDEVDRYLLSFEPGHVRAFAKILRFKRRETIEPWLPGLFRALGDGAGSLLADHAKEDPRQHVPSVEDALAFAQHVAARLDLEPGLRALARHEGAILELRTRPYRPWRRAARRRLELDCDPFALDRVREGGALPTPEPRPVRVEYRRRRRDVWCTVLG